jgi:hypothetical protein
MCNIYKDVDKPLITKAIGRNCSLAYCYNGHSFISLGDIPELDAPNYSILRNRVCLDGSEWLKPEMKEFMSHKLYESNKEYSSVKKTINNFNYKTYRMCKRIKGAILNK